MNPLFPPPPQPPSSPDGGGGGGGGFPAPSGIPNLQEMVGETEVAIESSVHDAVIPSPGKFSLDDERVICRSCKYSWIFRTMFEAKNPHPDGRPWLKSEGYCTAAPPTIVSLQQRAVYQCNRYKPDPEASSGRPRPACALRDLVPEDAEESSDG